MKTSRAKLDGYAVANTRNVLVSLEAYEQKLRTGGSKGAALESAAIVYHSLSGKRVTGRTVSRWLRVVKSYGGVAKTPGQAFGALKACPHVARPIRDLLRQVRATVARIERCQAKPGQADSRALAELAIASQLLGDLMATVCNNPAERHLLTIKALASRLANTSVHRLHRHMSAPEMEDALRAVLARVQAIPALGLKAAA